MVFPLNVSKMKGNDLDLFYAQSVAEAEAEYNLTITHQIANRPIGLPLFSALFFWPFKNTCFIEAGAIYISLLISFIGLIFFFKICL